MKTFSATVFTSSIVSALVSAFRPAILLGGAALLSACAGLGGGHTLQSEDAHHARDAAQAALSAEKDLNGQSSPIIDSRDKLPSVALTDELFYKILTAEIAYQRGSWQAAYVTLMSTAQKTGDPRLAKRSAEIALSVKQPGEALSAIRLWRELAPHSNEATQYYLGFMVMNNNLAEIQKVFSEKLAEAEPKQYGVIMLQAQRLLSRARDKNAAFDVLEEILTPYKTLPEAHLALAQGAYSKGDNPRAVKEAQQVLNAQSDSQLAILTIAQASSQPEALKALNAFISKNPKARDVRLAYASILIDQKQFDKATAEFEHLLKEKPEDLSTLYTLGVLAMERNKWQEAEDYFTRHLKISAEKSEEPDTTPVLLNLSRIAFERKDYQAAQDWLAKVESQDGRNPSWFNVQMRRAHLYAKMGKLAEGLQFLKNLKPANESEQLQVIQTEAQILRDNGQPEQALQVLQDGNKAHPDNADLLYDYAMLLESQNQYAEMETALRRIITLAPNSQHAYNALGYSFADRNIQLEEALTLITKADQLAPDDPFILDSLGWVKFRMKQFEEAEKALRHAYELRPDADIAAHYGELLWTMGHKDAARKIWREGRAKDPGNSSLKSTLERLNVRL